MLSAAYLQRGLLDEALRVIEQMIRLDPMDPAGHFKRGVLLQQKGAVYSDSVGVFRFANIPAGKRELHFRRLGFAPKSLGAAPSLSR